MNLVNIIRTHSNIAATDERSVPARLRTRDDDAVRAVAAVDLRRRLLARQQARHYQ